VAEPVFFETPEEFRAWLAEHHADRDGLIVGFHKRKTGRPSITWQQSVREALCFGWIDGVRRSIDDQRHQIRFTPRRRGSTWSAVNITLAQELIDAGEMQPAGLAAFEARTERKSRIYSYEQSRHELSLQYAERLRADAEAAAFFDAQAPWYRRTAVHWVMSAKREETRERRIATLIEDSRNGVRVKHLRRP
jgi:uncharacterized protein YdeI (YjbR/CyaY-like superfamily)